MVKGIKSTGRRVVKEYNYGMLVWQCSDGEFLVDDDGSFMHVFIKDDRDQAFVEAAKKALTQAARYYGFPEGRPVYWNGRRPITQEELDEQLERAAQGLVPDPLDVGAIMDEWRSLKK